MRPRALVPWLAVLVVSIGFPCAGSDPADAEGAKDPPVFSRMPGFHLYRSEEVEFDRFEFPVGSGKTAAVEGRKYYADYYANDGITVPSGLQVVRNYVNAATAIGGKKVYEYDDGGTQFVTLQVVKDDAETWTQVAAAGNGMYKVTMIRKEALKQAVVADAKALAGALGATGRAAIYGIYFDTDKSEIKPQSEAALVEIGKLLKNDPKLKLYVVGHTDNAGTFEHNVKLSDARAAAVVAALTGKQGIAAARLTPFGAGPTAPVASNATDEGRAKNRRVEIVAQ